MHGLRVTASAPNTASFSCYFQQNVLILTTCDTAQLATQASLTKTVSGRQKREAERFATSLQRQGFQKITENFAVQIFSMVRVPLYFRPSGLQLLRNLQCACFRLRGADVGCRQMVRQDGSWIMYRDRAPGEDRRSSRTFVVSRCAM